MGEDFTIGFLRSSGGKNCSFTWPQEIHANTGRGSNPDFPDGLNIADTLRSITASWNA